MALPLIMGALSVGKGILDANRAGRQHQNQLSAYRKMSEVTPSERKYQEHLRKIAEGGDPFQNEMMREQMNRVIGNIRQTGAENLQRTEGSIISQGMESSIVAAELRRKTSKDTMRSVAEQSRRISAENRAQQERTKRAAEERLFQSEMATGARTQQMEANIAGLGEFDRMGALGNIVLGGIQAYAGAGGTFGQTPTPGAGMPWEGISPETVSGMSDDQALSFFQGLDSDEQLKFMEYYRGLNK